MQLVKKEYTYDTYNMLKSMVDVGRVNHDRMVYNDGNRMKMIGFARFWSEFMPRFTFGRQTGQTTAIKQYLETHDNVMVMTFNERFRNDFYRDHLDRVGVIDNEMKTMKEIERFYQRRGAAGVQWEISRDHSIDTIIFDTCSRNQIANFLTGLSMVRNAEHQIKTMVSVGETDI